MASSAPQEANREPFIFISYAREDQAAYTALAGALKAHGWSVGPNESRLSGKDLQTQAALQASRCVLVLWSAHSVTSNWVLAEAKYALAHDKLVSVAIEPKLELPFKFRRIHTYILLERNSFEGSEAFHALVEAIAQKTGAPTAASNREPTELGDASLVQPVAQEHGARESDDAGLAAPKRASERGAGVRKRLYPWLRGAALGILATGIGLTSVWLTKNAYNALTDAATEETAQRVCLSRAGLAPEMALLPADTYMMGSPGDGTDREDDERLHQVSVEAFAIGRCEVTFEEYDVFAAATQREKPADMGWGRGRRPVINVSWEDAIAYAAWLSEQTGEAYRLPTEAEWEYAARARSETAYWWGPAIGTNNANCDDCGSEWDGVQTAPVGSFESNAFGLYDTAGNVWEWTCSTYDQNYDGGELVCAEASAGASRVLRGGSWNGIPRWLRSAYRFNGGASSRFDFVGFRLARAVR